MLTTTLGLFIPIILTVHNAEEYFAFEEMDKLPFFPCRERRVFLRALILLTLFASLIAFANYWMQGWQFMTTILVLALLLNGMQHLLSSLWLKRVVPGTYTAAFLLIPYALLYLWAFSRESTFGVGDLFYWSLLSAMFMAASISISLRI